MDENISAAGTKTTNYDVRFGDCHVDIDNDADANNNATRDINIAVGDDHFTLDEESDLDGNYTTDINASIDDATVNVDQSLTATGSGESETKVVETDVNATITHNGEVTNFTVDEEINTDGVKTEHIRLSVGDDYAQSVDTIEVNSQVTTDVDIKVNEYRLRTTTDIDADGDSTEQTIFDAGQDSAITTKETQTINGITLTTDDVALRVNDNTLTIDESLEFADDDIVTTTDVELNIGESRVLIDESGDGTTDTTISHGDSNSLFVDENADGTTDTTIVHGDGSVFVDESADGTTDHTITYEDTTIHFDESINGAERSRVITISSGASTIVIAADDTVTADLHVDDTHILRDAQGNIAVTLHNNQGSLQITNTGDVDIELRDGDSVIHLNEAGEFNANIVNCTNTVTFDHTGAFAASLIEGGSSLNLDSSGNYDVTLQHESSSVSFNDEGNLNVNLTDGASSVSYNEAQSFNAELVDNNGSRIQFNDANNYNVLLTDGSSQIGFDNTGDLDVVLTDGNNQLTLNEQGEFDVTLSDGTSSLTFDHEGQFAANFIYDTSQLSADSQGNYALNFDDGQIHLVLNSEGALDAQLDDGNGSTVSFNNAGEYAVDVTDGVNRIAFDHMGNRSATATVNDTTFSFARDAATDSTTVDVNRNDIGLSVTKDADSTDVELSAGDSSIGVIATADSRTVELTHEDTSLAINKDTTSTSVQITDGSNRLQATSSNGDASVELAIDDSSVNYTETGDDSALSLSHADTTLSVTNSENQKTVSLTDGTDKTASITDDGDGLDYTLTNGDASLTIANENGDTDVTLTKDNNSITWNKDDGVTATRDDVSLNLNKTDDGLQATVAKDDKTLTITGGDNGVSAEYSDGDKHYEYNKNASDSQLFAGKGDHEFTVVDDGNGIDIGVSLEDGDVVLALDNEADGQSASLNTHGINTDLLAGRSHINAGDLDIELLDGEISDIDFLDGSPLAGLSFGTHFDLFEVGERCGSTFGDFIETGDQFSTQSLNGLFSAIGNRLGDTLPSLTSAGSIREAVLDAIDDVAQFTGALNSSLVDALNGSLSGVDLSGLDTYLSSLLDQLSSVSRGIGDLDFSKITDQIAERASDYYDNELPGKITDKIFDELVDEGSLDAQETAVAKGLILHYVNQVLNTEVPGVINLAAPTDEDRARLTAIMHPDLAALFNNETTVVELISDYYTQEVPTLISDRINENIGGRYADALKPLVEGYVSSTVAYSVNNRVDFTKLNNQALFTATSILRLEVQNFISDEVVESLGVSGSAADIVSSVVGYYTNELTSLFTDGEINFSQTNQSLVRHIPDVSSLLVGQAIGELGLSGSTAEFVQAYGQQYVADVFLYISGANRQLNFSTINNLMLARGQEFLIEGTTDAVIDDILEALGVDEDDSEYGLVSGIVNDYATEVLSYFRDGQVDFSTLKAEFLDNLSTRFLTEAVFKRISDETGLSENEAKLLINVGSTY